FFRGDEAVIVQVEFAELFQLLAALQPFTERDLAIVVLVESLEPRRQALRQSARAAKDTNRERKGAGLTAALARRDDAVGPGFRRLMHQAHARALARVIAQGRDLAVRIFQADKGPICLTRVVDLIGRSGLQLDSEDLREFEPPVLLLGRRLEL